MIIYKRNGLKVTAEFTEPWIYSISNYFAKRGISERKFIEDYLNRRTKFTGVAKCLPTDKYDWNYGKELAKERLIKNYKDTLVILSHMLDELLTSRNSEQHETIEYTIKKFQSE